MPKAKSTKTTQKTKTAKSVRSPKTTQKAKTLKNVKIAKSAQKPKSAQRPKNAKNDLIFKPGDYVVYPTHGVGKVTDVETQVISGSRLKLFVISFDKNRMVLKVPIVKVETSGLRKLSSRKIMDGALSTLKGKARTKRTMWSRRAQEYEAKINSGDPVAIAEVVRDLYRPNGQPEQSFSERQIYESARDRLALELAAVDKSDIAAATERMEDVLTQLSASAA